MRNPNRIKPYCDTLATLWGMVPDWRLSQLMKNALNGWVNRFSTDPFYVEDEDFLGFLFEYITKIAGVKENEN